MSSRIVQQMQPVLSLDPADHDAAAAIALKQQRQRNSRSRSSRMEGEISDGSAFDEELDFGPEQECKYSDEGENTIQMQMQWRLHLMRRCWHCGQLTAIHSLSLVVTVCGRAVGQSCSRPRRRCCTDRMSKQSAKRSER